MELAGPVLGVVLPAHGPIAAELPVDATVLPFAARCRAPVEPVGAAILASTAARRSGSGSAADPAASAPKVESS